MAIANSLNTTSSGISVMSTSGLFTGRTITGTSNQVSISNGDGISGNPTISLTSTIYVTGISFDSGSNTLSNYSTGTYTPVLTGATSNPTVAYTTQVGRYTRIGDAVFFNFKVVLSSTAGGSGNVQISAPFTEGGPIKYNSVIMENTTFSGVAKYLLSRQSGGETDMKFSSCRDGAGIQFNVCSQLSNTSTYIGSHNLQI